MVPSGTSWCWHKIDTLTTLLFCMTARQAHGEAGVPRLMTRSSRPESVIAIWTLIKNTPSGCQHGFESPTGSAHRDPRRPRRSERTRNAPRLELLRQTPPIRLPYWTGYKIVACCRHVPSRSEHRSASGLSAMSLTAIFSNPCSIPRGDLFRSYLRQKFMQQRRRIVLLPD